VYEAFEDIVVTTGRTVEDFLTTSFFSLERGEQMERRKKGRVVWNTPAIRRRQRKGKPQLGGRVLLSESESVVERAINKSGQSIIAKGEKLVA